MSGSIRPHHTNGTFVNDVMIPIQGMELPDTAIIRTGSTTWTFMKVALPGKPENLTPDDGKKGGVKVDSKPPKKDSTITPR